MRRRPPQPANGLPRHHMARLRAWALGLLLVALSTLASVFPPTSMVWPGSQTACADVAVTVAVKPDCSPAADLLDYRIAAGHSHGPPTSVDAQRNAHQTYYVLAGNTPALVHNTDCPRTIADENGGRVDSYDSWEEARAALDDGSGMDIHHIVEQGTADPWRGGFPVRRINSTDNLIRLTPEVHDQISRYYSSRPAGFTEIVRFAIRRMSFEEQHAFGMDVIRRAMAGTL